MAFSTGKFLSAGTRVKVSSPCPVPSCSTWEDDGQRTSTPVKRRLQQLFFRGDRRISAEVVYIPNPDERLRLRGKGLTKVQLRDPAGSMIVITAPSDVLQPV